MQSAMIPNYPTVREFLESVKRQPYYWHERFVNYCRTLPLDGPMPTADQFEEYSTGLKKTRHCPSCQSAVERTCVPCGMTYGRRGWRQLGVYDG